ncbi:zinc ABC transporter substrate-binding protein [bacterium]|nr:zinc ABC transporter substrate-binding protein [bacterium]
MRALAAHPRVAASAAATASTVAVAAILLLVQGAGPARAESVDSPIGAGTGAAPLAVVSAFCSIAPQEFFVERVGGELVSVKVLVGPGQSPHTFEPTPRQMADLAESDVYFAIGLPFENRLLGRVEKLGSGIQVIDTSEGIPRRPVEDTHGHDEEDGSAHDDERGGLPDPHTWLNPRFAKMQARNICSALKELIPEHGAELEANLSRLLRDLDALDAELADALGPLAGESIYVFHPAFGYFTDAYGLRQVPIELGGMEPSARELAGLMDHATSEGVRVIFVQPQFSTRSARAMAEEIGGVVVPIDPLSADYMDNLRNIAREVAQALREGQAR